MTWLWSSVGLQVACHLVLPRTTSCTMLLPTAAGAVPNAAQFDSQGNAANAKRAVPAVLCGHALAAIAGTLPTKFSSLVKLA